MIAQSDPVSARGRNRAVFELERFGWGAHERLEISGRFSGLGDGPSGPPVLILRGPDGTHRLPVIPESSPELPEKAGRWQAAFAWPHASAPFDVALLALGSDLFVELPQPRAKRRPFGHQVLEVRPARNGDEAPSGEDGAPADLLRSRAELLAAQHEASMRRSDEELSRMRENLEAERTRRSTDAERFRQGLASVRAAAEEALAVEQSVARQLDADLRVAQEARRVNDALLTEARRELEAATASRQQAMSQANAEIDRLRMRVAALERGAEEADALRAQLDRGRADAESLRDGLAAAQKALGGAN